MYGHFVPKVYQKAWHTINGRHNIYYFDKNNLTHPLDSKGGNLKKNMGEEDLYIFTAEDINNGSTSAGDDLEKEFNEKLESKWNNVLDEIQNMIRCSNSVPSKITGINHRDINQDTIDNLLSFIILQFFRIKENFKKTDNGMISAILNVCRDYYSSFLRIDKSTVPDLSTDQRFFDTVWKQVLKDCFDSSFDGDSLLSKILNEFKELQVAIITDKTATPGLLLGDNPVIMNTGTTKPINDLESGVFMPINPNTLIALIKIEQDGVESGDFLILNANLNFFKFINNLLVLQSNNIIGFCDNTVSHLVSSSFSKSDWDSMFN